MELKLNYLPNCSPIDGQDIKWLKYMWECSDGFNVAINMEKLPDHLVHTVLYPRSFLRFSYYRDTEHLLNFEYNEEKNTYDIVLEKGFVSILNGLIDECNRKRYITVDPIQHIREKGEVVVNNHINNSGTFNSSVNNQIGNENSSTQSPASQKKERIKFDFMGLVYALLKKIPFIKDFVKKD